MTYSENLFVGQVQGLTMHLTKTVRALKELQRRLLAKPAARGGKQITRTSAEKQVKAALSAQFLGDVVRYDLAEVDGRPQLTLKTEGRRYKDHMTLTERNPLQQKLMGVLHLDRYAISQVEVPEPGSRPYGRLPGFYDR